MAPISCIVTIPENLCEAVGLFRAAPTYVPLKWPSPKTWVKPLEFLIYLSCNLRYNNFRFEGGHFVLPVPPEIEKANIYYCLLISKVK